MTKEEKLILDFFSEEHIEYFASSPIEALPLALPRLLPEGTKTAVVFLIPYKVKCNDPRRNVSSYAVSRDYHLYASQLSERLGAKLRDSGSPHKALIMCDHSPLAEKHAAVSLKLGIRGKNSLIINEKYGSDVFIAEILTDADMSLKHTDSFAETHTECENCGRCISACPTLLHDGSECVSSLTQKKRPTVEDERILETASLRWGCDICREVCPHNDNTPETPIAFFHESRIEYVSAGMIAAMSDEEFKERAYSWRGREFAEKRFE